MLVLKFFVSLKYRSYVEVFGVSNMGTDFIVQFSREPNDAVGWWFSRSKY